MNNQVLASVVQVPQDLMRALLQMQKNTADLAAIRHEQEQQTEILRQILETLQVNKQAPD